jgi:hypothetical protein
VISKLNTGAVEFVHPADKHQGAPDPSEPVRLRLPRNVTGKGVVDAPSTATKIVAGLISPV